MVVCGGTDHPLCGRSSCGGLASRHAAAQDHPAILRVGIGENGGDLLKNTGSSKRTQLLPAQRMSGERRKSGYSQCLVIGFRIFVTKAIANY